MLEICFHHLLHHTTDPRKHTDLAVTPARAAKAFKELLSGYEVDPTATLIKSRQEATCSYSGIVEIPEISFVSFCEHTFLPFMGTVSLCYQPGQYWVDGLSLESMIQAHSRRLQLQESLTAQIWNTCFAALEPKTLKIKMEARHACMNGKLVRTEMGS